MSLEIKLLLEYIFYAKILENHLKIKTCRHNSVRRLDSSTKIRFKQDGTNKVNITITIISYLCHLQSIESEFERNSNMHAYT